LTAIPRASAICHSLVINDANFPWLLLVPRRADMVDLIDLDRVEQAQLMTEITRVALALREHNFVTPHGGKSGSKAEVPLPARPSPCDFRRPAGVD